MPQSDNKTDWRFSIIYKPIFKEYEESREEQWDRVS